MTVGAVILTLNAAKELSRVLVPLKESPIVARILVWDSSSADETVAIARASAVEVSVRPREEFNHGASRESARRLIGTDIVIFLTQDVIPEMGFVESLVAPLLTGVAGVSYARQLPHVGAKFLEAFPREFNYPRESHVRTLGDVARYGVYTFFCSDSCAAYLNSALDAVGGFQPTLTNEDYFAAAKLLRAGFSIAYVAEARVAHSHRYTLADEFRRYFDTGYVRGENLWISRLVGEAEGRGACFMRQMLRRLWREQPLLIPYAVMQTGVKWLGFRVGFWSRRAPRWWKRALSGQRYYWDSRYYPELP